MGSNNEEVIHLLQLRSLFHPAVAQWFAATFKEPTPPQQKAWPLIAKGKDALILAPTGSGKTLTAFLYALDWLYQKRGGDGPSSSVQILYISPLKALNNDIYHNLESPLKGIEEMGEEMGYHLPPITRAIRTGDTPNSQRRKMIKDPPQILITTPESLFLLLSSKAATILKGVRFLIIDEIHALFPNKRGAHLSLSLARLSHLVGDKSIQRIGLSATMAPLEEVASFLGYRGEPVTIVNIREQKSFDLKILLPVESFISIEEKTVWPSLYRLLLDLLREARATLIFVNNRRLAERITSNLNHLAREEVAMTHHGSVSREVRHEVEGRLRRGELPCIVATSSLELGIDIGFIDQVIQVESPKEVARGLQRVGRAGHLLDLTSSGRIIPKNRSDLLESYVILKEMREGRIEEISPPQYPLDILAQHLVAMPATQDWPIEEMYKVVRSAYHYSALPREDFFSLLSMLSGLYEMRETLDIKPRLYWDRTENVVSKNPYGVRLSYLGVGAIPDRGYYRVQLGEGGVFLGELDEEFVYERRLGDRFLLGTSAWRIEEIKKDRVIVSPSGQGEAMAPFWRAEQGGRSYQLGRRVGEFMERSQELLEKEMGEEKEGSAMLSWLKEGDLLEEAGAKELYSYVKGGWEALCALPTHRHLIVEEFPDELGDRRVILHSPYGARLHLLLFLLLQDQLKGSLKVELEALHGDDGIMFHVPRDIPFRGFNFASLEDNLEERLAYLLSKTPLFSITFRHIAQLSLVLPRGTFKKRKPLYLSRLQAENLLQGARGEPMFPLIQETFRELLHDYFPLEEAKALIRAINRDHVHISYCKRSLPSPFASNHLFNFVAGFMYRAESPKGERGLLGIKPLKLKTMLGERGFRDLFSEEDIRGVVERAREGNLGSISKETALYYLEKQGDLLDEDLPSLFPGKEREAQKILASLAQGGQAISFMIGDKTFLTTPHKLPLYLEASPPIAKREAISSIILQYAKTHGPFTLSELKARYRWEDIAIKGELDALTEEGLLIEGAFTPKKQKREWCHRDLLQEIHRKSLARRRRSIETKSREDYSHFLLEWHGIGRRERLEQVLDQLKYLSLPAHLWETGILPSRLSSYSPLDLDLLISSGLFYWQAKGAATSFHLSFLPRTPPEDELYGAYAEGKGQLREEAPQEESLSKGALEVIEILQKKGALSLPQLLVELRVSTPSLWQSLEELLLLGLITNDTLGPIRYLLSTSLKNRSNSVLSPSLLSTMGRWSLIEAPTYKNLFVEARALLHRHGIISYPIVKREGGDFSHYYPALKELEALGQIERGYLIEGLGGIQYALVEAREALMQAQATCAPSYYALSYRDPANPLALFKEEGMKGDWVVFKRGSPLLLASGMDLKIKTSPSSVSEDLREAFLHLIRIISPLYQGKKIIIKEIDGKEKIHPSMGGVLEELGFEDGYGGYALWPSTRNKIARQ